MKDLRNLSKHFPFAALSVNTTLSGPLLSRFDIVLVLLDKKNPKLDGIISSHILAQVRFYFFSVELGLLCCFLDKLTAVWKYGKWPNFSLLHNWNIYKMWASLSTL